MAVCRRGSDFTTWQLWTRPLAHSRKRSQKLKLGPQQSHRGTSQGDEGSLKSHCKRLESDSLTATVARLQLSIEQCYCRDRRKHLKEQETKVG